MLTIPRADVIRVLKATREVERRQRNPNPPRRARWQGRTTPNDATPFELYDDVAPGDMDKYAWKLKNDSGSLVRNTAADKIQVSDEVLGDVRAYGSNHSGFSTGVKGWCVRGYNGKYQIVSIQQLAKSCRATAKGAISGSSGTVDNVTALDDGQSPVANASEELSVDNPLNFYVPDDGFCLLRQNGAGWYIDGAALVAETFDTAQQATGTTLQHKTRATRVNAAGDESDWSTWHTGTEECP